MKTKRIIDSLASGNNKYDKIFITKIKTCPICFTEYRRIPLTCLSCSTRLIRQSIKFSNNLELPQFLIGLTEESYEFINNLRKVSITLNEYISKIQEKLKEHYFETEE